jgi:putative ABC transport system permease protein
VSSVPVSDQEQIRWTKMVWTLAKRELRGGYKGFRIFFLCLLLGVSAIASVGAIRSAFVKGLDTQSRELMGGDLSVSLTHRPMDADERAFVEGWGTVSYIAAMRSMAHFDGPQPGKAQLIELKAVDPAYPLFGAVILKEGGDFSKALTQEGGPEDLYGVVVEETLLSRMGLGVGDTFRIGALRVMVKDIITDEPDRVAGGFRYGPRVMISMEGLEETGLVQLGSLITHRTRIALDNEAMGLSDIEAFKEDALAVFPNGSWNIQDRRRSAPGVRFFMDRVAMFLTMIGLAALIVGGVGVGNAVSSYLAAKREVIATLKCLGAEGRTIFAVYLLQVLIMAASAIVIGLMIGGITPFAIGYLLEDLLPIPVEFGFYPLAMIEATSFGILVTLIFSLWPLGEARDLSPARLFRGFTDQGRVRPRAGVLLTIGFALAALCAIAIFTSGYPPFSAVFLAGTAVAMGGLAGAGWLSKRFASGLPRISHAGLRLAVSNLHRPGAPTISVVLSMGLGLTLLVIVVLVDGNLDHQIKEQIPKDAPSFFFIDIQKTQIEAFQDVVAQETGAHVLQLVPNLRGAIFSINGVEPKSENVDPDARWVLRGDRGLTYSSTLPKGSKVVEGTWWPEDYEGPPLISLEADVGRGLGLKIGDTIGITVLGRPIVAEIASFRELEWRTVGFNYVFVYPPSALSAAPHTWVGNLALLAGDEEKVHQAITSTFQNVTVVRVKEALSSINDLLGDIIAGIRVTSIVTMSAGVLVLAGALAAGHKRRLYDAVVLKVLGARRGFIAFACLLEFALLGLLTALIAAALGSFASYLILTLAMDSTWIFLPGRVGATIVGAVILTLFLGVLGTWTTLGARPARHLRSE